MAISAWSAWWFLPFVLPLCFYVAFTDLREMRITNQAVGALVVEFALVGLIALPFDEYLWRFAQLGIVLVITIILNAVGAMGAGDSKFIAAAAPYLAVGDTQIIIALYTASLLAAFSAHRLAKHSALHRMAPHWISWNQGKKFPMGFALGGTLAFYLILGAIFGS
ncbi:prepilin peptidase [Pseudosulfitobacter koreensis]|uniref:Prepilin peptidase n=1 Tax=Pseudosulfitobacter koreensis TaxID=2968472 RepID=A0ABT1Z344_9RHOB|nr:prepilin peptidase [Pseudosulfitobacter koreense]MCR8827564.1 prepilin peptidase [Pseudosulfitobacter koreense]